METNRFPSFLGSLCLHLATLALVLLWPASEPTLRQPEVIRFDYEGIVDTRGLRGALNPDAKSGAPAPADRAEQAVDVPPADDTKVAAQEPQQVKPVVNKDGAEARPQPKQPPKKDPDAVPIPKEDAKKEPLHNATAQKDVPKKNATEPKKPVKNATAPKKPAKNATQPKKPVKNATKSKSSGTDLKDALADLRKDAAKGATNKGGSPRGASGGQGLADALGDLRSQTGGGGTNPKGTGHSGQDGAGYGVFGAYSDSVVSRVKPNWHWAARADRKTYSADVHVWIGQDGTIGDVRLIRSSGNSLFDASILRAVRITRQLEPPPSGVGDMVIEFHSSMLK